MHLRWNILLWLGWTVVAMAAAPDDWFPPVSGQGADFAVRRAGAEAGASVRIVVTNEGFYRITAEDLVVAGVDPLALTGSAMRLFNGPREAALEVSREGAWGVGDWLVFYGTGRRGTCSDENVYWLGFEGGGGLRMEARDGAPLAAAPVAGASPHRVRYEKKTFLQDKFRPKDASHDHWYCAILTETGTLSFAVATPGAVTSEPAVVTAVLYGHSASPTVEPDHLTRMWVGGVHVGGVLFEGQIAVTQSLAFAGSLVKGRTKVAFRQYPRKGLTVDRVFLDSFEIGYVRRLEPEGGALLFDGWPVARTYAVSGDVGGVSAWLADVTDPLRPVLLAGAEAEPGGGLRFGDEAGGTARRYAVYAEGALKRPAGVEVVERAGLGDPDRQADYVILAPRVFVPAAGRLAARRALEGLTTAVVALPDVYDEFGYGVEEPAAIRQFIGYMAHHWRKPAPRYVLLAGAGSYDPKGYMAAQRGERDVRKRERIPVVMGPSDHGWAAMDGWYGAVVGADPKPDMAIGRLPAFSAAMLSNMVDKILAFEKVSWGSWRRRQALLVADRADQSLNGRKACEWLRKYDLAPNGFWSSTAYADDVGEALCRDIVFSAVDSGVALVYYFGHGDASRWGRDMLTYRDVALFKNAFPPVFLMMACRNGAYQNPVDGPCMMEALLQDKDNGASACIGTTAISYGSSAVSFSDGFSDSFIVRKDRRLGDAFLSGLSTLSDYFPTTQELLYLNLFGDPAMRINP